MNFFEKLPTLPKLPEIPEKLDLKTFQRFAATGLYIFFLCKLLLAFISSHIFNPLFPDGLGGGIGGFLWTTLKVVPAMAMEALSGLIGYNIFKIEAEKDSDSKPLSSYRGYLIAIVVLDVVCIIYKALVFGAGNYAFVYIPFTSLIAVIGAIILNLSEEKEPECINVKEIVVQPATPPPQPVKEPSAPKKINGMVKVFEAGASDRAR